MKSFQFLNNQRGAMFGLDARIALVIASILAAVTGVSVMSRLDSNRQDAAERGVLELRAGLENYYTSVGVTALPTSLTALFDQGIVEDSTLQLDPWGNSWNYNRITASKTVDGVPVTVQMAVIHSSGKDAVNDSTDIANESQYTAWVQSNDDVGIKFSSLAIERERVERFRELGRQITDKLEAFEAARYLTANNTCTSSPSDSICEHSSTSYTQYNYYPRSSLDSGSAVYFDPTVSGNYQTYTAGNTSDMQQLMTDIGLPTSFATDPWDRTLYYDSNATDRTIPPFTAAICFTASGSCF